MNIFFCYVTFFATNTIGYPVRFGTWLFTKFNGRVSKNRYQWNYKIIRNWWFYSFGSRLGNCLNVFKSTFTFFSLTKVSFNLKIAFALNILYIGKNTEFRINMSIRIYICIVNTVQRSYILRKGIFLGFWTATVFLWCLSWLEQVVVLKIL